MKKCPFCTAALTDHAIKCGACGQLLVDTDPGSAARDAPVTQIQPERWAGRTVVLRSDGSGAAERGMSKCPACGRTISVGGQLEHWKSHLIVAPGDGDPGGLMWRCPCKESKVYLDEGTAIFDLALEMILVHGVAPDQPMERWLNERGVTPIHSGDPADQRRAMEQASPDVRRAFEQFSPLKRSVGEQLTYFAVTTHTPTKVIGFELQALEASDEWRAREAKTCPLALFVIGDPDAGPEAAGSGATVAKAKRRAVVVLVVTDDALLLGWTLLPKLFGKPIHHVDVVPFHAVTGVNALSVAVGLGVKDPGFEVLADRRYSFQVSPRGDTAASVDWRDRAVATIRERAAAASSSEGPAD
jgi:hypothetical protein